MPCPCLVSDDDEDVVIRIHHDGVSVNPRDINDSLTRGENPAHGTGVATSPGIVFHHIEDVFTSITLSVSCCCYLTFRLTTPDSRSL